MNHLFFALLFSILTALSCYVDGAIFKHQLVSSRSLKGGKKSAKDPIESLAKAREAISRLEKKLAAHGDKFYKHIKDEKQGKSKWLKPKKASTKQDVESAMLIDYIDDFFLVNISVGTPPQWFLVQPTIESSNFWVIDSECNYEACLGAVNNFQRHLFNRSLSQSFHFIDEAAYEVDAGIVTDKLTIGELTAQQNFALFYELDSGFYDYPMDGMLGLGSYPGTFYLNNVPSVMQTLKPFMDHPVFSIFIRSEDDLSDDDSGGQLTFGSQDSENCESDWTYTWVNNHTFMSAYWEFQVNGFTIKNDTKTVDNHRRRPAMIALNFPFMVGPAGNVQTIAESMGFTFSPKYKAWMVPCSRVASLPDLQLKIGDSTIVLKASQLIKKFNTGNGYLCPMILLPHENEGDGPAWLFGDAFLRSYCVSFEIGNGRGSQSTKNALQVGFAKTKPVVDSD